MADVAAEAGVSVMTVSRVLNDFPGVADDTRRRVERAITALGYQANTAARILAGGRSGVIGVIAVESEQFGPSHTLFGIEAAARAAGQTLSFVTMAPSGEDMGATLDRLRASHVDGVIIVAPVREVVEAATRIQGDLPMVVVGGDPTIGSPTVTIDQEAGARRATQHLLDLGHPTVHHITGPKNWIDAAARTARLVRDLARRWCTAAATTCRRLERGWGLRRRGSARERSGGHGRLRGKRPDRARRDPGLPRRRSRGARRRQHRRVRRHA